MLLGAKVPEKFTEGLNKEDVCKKDGTSGLGDEILRQNPIRTSGLSEKYHDVNYTHDLTESRFVRDQTRKVLKNHECVVLPTALETALIVDKKAMTPVMMCSSAVYFDPTSVSGMLHVSFQDGSDSSEFSIGMQRMGVNFKESALHAFSQW